MIHGNRGGVNTVDFYRGSVTVLGDPTIWRGQLLVSECLWRVDQETVPIPEGWEQTKEAQGSERVSEENGLTRDESINPSFNGSSSTLVTPYPVSTSVHTGTHPRFETVVCLPTQKNTIDSNLTISFTRNCTFIWLLWWPPGSRVMISPYTIEI